MKPPSHLSSLCQWIAIHYIRPVASSNVGAWEKSPAFGNLSETARQAQWMVCIQVLRKRALRLGGCGSIIWNELGLYGRRVTGKDGGLDYHCVRGQVKINAHRTPWHSHTNQHTEHLLLSRIRRLMRKKEAASDTKFLATYVKTEGFYSRYKVGGHNPFHSWWPVLFFRQDWREEVGNLSPDGTAEAEVGKKRIQLIYFPFIRPLKK